MTILLKNTIEHNPNQIHSHDHSYRILPIHGLGAKDTNILLYFLKCHSKIDRIYLFPKFLYQPKCRAGLICVVYKFVEKSQKEVVLLYLLKQYVK